MRLGGGEEDLGGSSGSPEELITSSFIINPSHFLLYIALFSSSPKCQPLESALCCGFLSVVSCREYSFNLWRVCFITYNPRDYRWSLVKSVIFLSHSVQGSVMNYSRTFRVAILLLRGHSITILIKLWHIKKYSNLTYYSSWIIWSISLYLNNLLYSFCKFKYYFNTRFALF